MLGRAEGSHPIGPGPGRRDDEPQQTVGSNPIPRRTIAIVPSEPIDNGWVETLAPRFVGRRLEADTRVDVAVIGAGFCGLAAARRLHELDPGLEVAVIDAQAVGQGASGRSSGFVVGETDTATGLTPAAREGYLRQSQLAIEHLRTLHQDCGFDCDWDDRGWLRAAAGEVGCRTLEGLIPKLESLGAVCQRLDADGLREITGSTFYRAGVRVVGAPLVHSGKLSLGLAKHLPEAVALYEESPVTTLELGDPHRLHTPGGTLTCDRLVLATNGYSPHLGVFRSRIFPLFTFGTLTRVLTPEEQTTLGGESEWGLLAMDPMGSSVRRTRGQRLLIRNTIHYDQRLRVDASLRRDIEAGHRVALARRFPTLDQIDFEHSWAGLMGTSRNAMPSFADIGPGCVAAGGFTGAGIALGTSAGRALAERVLGQDSEAVRDFQRLPPATWMPPEPFRSLGGGFLARRMNRKADPATL